MMTLYVNRFSEYEGSTISRLSFDDIDLGHGLEDGHNEPKIPGETRIPAGRYRLKLRTYGGFHERYKKASWIPEGVHIGMIEICGVPGFKHILIHPGNRKKDTRGCLLPGASFGKEKDGYVIYSSRKSYLRLYVLVAKKLAEGEEIWAEVTDPEQKVAA